jgi:integrase
MVKPFKMGNRKNYYFQVMINGNRIVESTGETFYNKAIKKAAERTRELKNQEDYSIHLKRLVECVALLPMEKQEPAIRECLQLISSSSQTKMTLENVYASFIEKPRNATASRSTTNSYKRVWRGFLSWLKDNYPEKVYLNEISEVIAEEYMTRVWKKGVAEQTYNENIKVLRSMFNVIGKSAGLTTNVWKAVKKIKVNSISKKPLTKEDFVSIMKVAEGEIKLLLIIGFYTGLRLGDACLLKWDEVNLKTGLFKITPSKTRGHDKTVDIPIHGILLEILQRIYPSENTYVLPTVAASYSKDPGAVSKKIQKTFIKAGIKTTEERKRGVKDATVYGFHSLRHSFISLCAAEGIPQHIVREIVGHSSDTIHQIYQHASVEQKRKAIDLFPKIEE